MATLQEITARVKAAVGEDPGLGKTLKLDFKGEGFIFVDGGAVTNEDQVADCTFAMSKDDFEAMARGRMDPAMAMMRGRLKVDGDLSVAMRLKSILERAHG